MECDLWQGIVNITQVSGNEGSEENEISWLCNPFGDDTVYTTQFVLDLEKNDDQFSWNFFLSANKKDSAETKALYLLNYLRENFPGLTGKVSTKKVNNYTFNNHSKFYEIVFPEPPYKIKFTLFKRIIDIFYFLKKIENHVAKFYIIWQKDDSVSSSTITDELYKIKIFFSIETKSFEEKVQSNVIKAYVQHITSDFRNSNGESAIVKSAPPKDTWNNILKEMTFFKNTAGDYTGKYYNELKKLGWMPHWMPGFIKPEEIDLVIPLNIPINKAVGLKYERSGFNTDSDESKIKILLGNYINKYGVKTEQKQFFYLNDLNRHLNILGLNGNGKTYFLYHLVNEISKKAPNVGVLVILLRKGEEKVRYNCDRFYEYPNVRIPYCFDREGIQSFIKTLAKTLSSILGLHDIFEWNMGNTIKAYFEKHKRLPDNLKHLFKLYWDWFKKKKYPGDFGGTSVLAIENRVYNLINPEFESVTKLAHELPIWFQEFIDGKNVILDLSSITGDLPLLKLVTHFIIQMIRIFIPSSTEDTLKYAVIIDEIEHIAKNRIIRDSDDNLTVIQSYLAEVFEGILEHFRSRGVGLITVGKEASTIFNGIYSLVSLNILFNIKINEVKYFTTSLEEQMSLSSLGKRQACIINAVRKQRFLFYTPDLVFQK